MLTAASLLHFPDKPFAYGLSRSTLRVILRAPAGAVAGGRVAFGDRYDWAETDWAPMRQMADLRLYAHDGEADYWAADLEVDPPRPRYRFGLKTADGMRWLGFDGLADQPRPAGSFEFPYIADDDLPDVPSWAAGATFYQVFPERFARSRAGHRRGPVAAWDSAPTPTSFLGGDLDGIVEHLDHIVTLGVDGIYLTPVFTAPSVHKYDTADYFAVDPDFGGNPALRRLVAAAHARGIRLLLDGVFNHSGGTWPPFLDAVARGKDSPHRDWFNFEDDGYETFATDIPSMPKLRTSEPALRDLVLRVGRFWIDEYGVDGWRLDVAHEVGHTLWRRFRTAVREADPEAFLVGETWDWALPWLRGDQFDSYMNYPLRRAMLSFAGGGDAEVLLNAYDAQRAAYPEPLHSMLFNLLGSHDVERPLFMLNGSREAAAFAACLLFTLPGVAAIYYGDEVGMNGGKEPANRGGMVWQAERQDARTLDVYRRLGALRRRLPALKTGAYQRLRADGGLAAFARGSAADRLVVLANAAPSDCHVAASDLEDWLGGAPRVEASVAYAAEAALLGAKGISVPSTSVVVVGRMQGKES